jgi:tRNA 2-thiouridine synthesizing protein A
VPQPTFLKELNLGQLDAQGLKCPLPVLRVRKYMKTLDIGEELEVLVTDPSAPEDFKLFCEQSGQEFVRTSQDGGVINIILRRMK